MTAIQIENLSKIYGKVRALDGLNLQVEAGTIFGFLGPNGAGKTTTIRMLTGLAKPSSGSARVAGESITDPLKVAAHIGYLPEEPSLYGWMTPIELLDHVGRLFNLPSQERKQRAQDLLEQVGLAEVRKRRIRGFSRGMRQRLGLAQAMINRPQVLFLDEPASALDPVGRKDILELISNLRGECTVFMSTHILADVERVCDTIGIINHGKLIKEARQDDLLAQYTIPAFEIEVENGLERKLESWIASLHSKSWVQSVSADGHHARIIVRSIQQAQQELLPNLLQAGLILRKYEIVTPSLEDIFIRLTNSEEGKAP